MKFNRKNKILLGSILLMLVVSYKLAFQKTINLSKDYSANLEKTELIKNIPEKLSFLSQKEQHLDAQLSNLNADDSSIHNSLLKFLNREAQKHKVKIIEFNSPHTIREKEQVTETYIFNLEGGYTNILKTIHALENNGNFGAIAHLGLEKKKDYRNKRTYLQATIFLEQVK